MNRRPRLRDDLAVVEQRYRGEQSYIVKDPATHKYFRFKPLEVLVMQQLTGEHTVEELAAGLSMQGLPLTPAALHRFVERLRRMELLERSLAEKSVLLLERLRAERRRRIKNTHYNGSLLRMRWSVGDPDHLFDRWLPRLRFCFTPAFMVVSVALFVVYFAVFVTRWPEVAAGIVAMYTAEFFTLENIVLFWGTAMVVIIIHELGHGFACKHFGGQVHEMGAMLIYFQPAFYCNVNDAWTFPRLSHRIWVTAAGSWIQLVVAGLAAMVWVVVDPGTVIARIAFFAVLVGGATTVLANANPLIPLDGYYALSDWLEVPNLRQRALGHIGWLIKRYLLRLQVPEPDADARERRIFVIYGVLALLYITLILTIVALVVLGWLSGALGALGVAAFVLLLWALLRSSLKEWGRNVVNAVREHRDVLTERRRLIRVGGGAAAVLLLLLLVPWPLRVGGGFVVMPGQLVRLAVADSGVLREVLADEGARVAAGDAVARLENPALEREAVRFGRVADSLAALAAAARARGAHEAARALELERAEVLHRAQGVRERVARLTLRAPRAGVVVTPRFAEHVGRAYAPGETVVQVAAGPLEARTTLQRAGAGAVAAGQRASLFLGVGTGRTVDGDVVAVLPAADAEETLEIRIRLPEDGEAWRPGLAGDARVTVRRSNLLGALWWGLRKRLRNDLLL